MRVAVAVRVIAVVLLCACSSKGKPAGPDGSGGSAGGSGGSGGSDAGAAGTGGGSGSGGGAGAGTDGGPLTTADQLCRAAIRARCERLAACSAYPDGADGCAAISELCPGYFFNPDSTRTIDAVAACIDELQQESCSDMDLGLFPSCWSPGTRPTGAPCPYASVCQSGTCSSITGSCGTCGSGAPAATGESCASLRCRAGDFCHPGTKLCTPGNTIVHAAPGQPCDTGAVPSLGCTGDMHCVGPYGQTAGTCQPLPLWNLGQACYETATVGQCRPPLTCFVRVTPTATTSECQAPAPEPNCPTAPCDATQFCKQPGDGTVRCVRRAAVGETCAGDGGITIAQCVAGAFCVGTTGVCTTYAKLGEACADVVQPCGQYLTCTNGRCALLGNETCPLSPADAGAH